MWEEISQYLTFPESTALEICSSSFSQILRERKQERRDFWLLTDVVGITNIKKVKEIIKDMKNDNYKLFFTGTEYGESEESEESEEMDLLDGIKKSEYLFEMDSWQDIEALQEYANELYGNNEDDKDENEDRKHEREKENWNTLWEKIQNSFVLRCKIFNQFCENIGASYNMRYFPGQSKKYFIKEIYDYEIIHSIFTFFSYGMGGDMHWGLFLGRPLSEDEQEEKEDEDRESDDDSDLED